MVAHGGGGDGDFQPHQPDDLNFLALPIAPPARRLSPSTCKLTYEIQYKMPTQMALPTELLRLIFSHCETKTLKNARLASRRFSDLAAEELFREVYFTFLPEYMEKLASIGESISLGKLVQTIFFYHKTLNELYLDFRSWWSAIDARPPLELLCKSVPGVPSEPLSKRPLPLGLASNRVHEEMPRDDLPNKVLERCHGQFLYHYRGQRGIMSDPDTPIRLASIFARFPNLSTVLEYRRCWGVDAPAYRSLLGNLDPPCPIITKMHKDTLLPHPFYSRSGTFYEQWSAHMLCKSLEFARAKLRELELKIGSKIRIRRLYSEPFLSAFPSSTKGLMHLRTLNLYMKLPAASTFSRSSSSDFFSQFREFLQVSPHLETLRLSISIFHDNISPLLGCLKISTLRDLYLTLGSIRGFEFSEFLKRHASTLRSLSLKYLNTRDDITAGFESAWESVIKTFTPFMSLTRCSIKHLTEDQPLGLRGSIYSPVLRHYKLVAY